MSDINFRESYGTLSETINGLMLLGYTHDFNIKNECIVCNQINVILAPEDFKIDKVYRFEGVSDPDYQSILYAISATKHDLKGVLVNGYGISADDATSEMIERLETHAKQSIIEDKSNEATPRRPEGNRLLEGQLVEMDWVKSIAQIKNERTWAESDHNSLTLFKSDTMRIVVLGLHQDAELKPHKTNGVISVQVLEGTVKFITEDQTYTLEKGQMIALHDNITHSVVALTEAFFMLTVALNK